MVGIHGGDDKKFSLKQGILTHSQVCLSLNKERSCRTKERERECVSIQRCIVGTNLSILDLIIGIRGGRFLD